MTKIMDGMFSVMDGNGILSISYKPSDISRMLTKIVWRRYQSYYDQILRNDLYLLIEDYEKYLQSSIKEVKQKQDTRCMTMTNKYVQGLDKIANLEINLTYQQEYFQQY
jgi:hypothetical protein